LHIALGDYTVSQQDAGATEGNQQLVEQLWHTKENNTPKKTSPRIPQIPLEFSSAKNFLIKSATASTF
jgi:hypothetical protein